MERRTFLRGTAVAGLAMCPTCLGTVGALASGPTGRPWGYDGEEGPAYWGDLSPEYRICELGLQQSPIDLTAGISANAGSVAVSWRSVPLNLVNTGHTLQVNCEAGSDITLDSARFDLVQFHFHHPSEHLVNGVAYDMEAHFVHADQHGRFVVLGVFLTAGRPNAALAPIWQAMPREAGQTVEQPTLLTPVDLLPARRGFFRYYGSLTTPPCSERVTWVVFAQPVEASDAQIRQFAALFPNNARPVQPLNRRFLLENLSTED